MFYKAVSILANYSSNPICCFRTEMGKHALTYVDNASFILVNISIVPMYICFENVFR